MECEKYHTNQIEVMKTQHNHELHDIECSLRKELEILLQVPNVISIAFLTIYICVCACAYLFSGKAAIGASIVIVEAARRNSARNVRRSDGVG